MSRPDRLHPDDLTALADLIAARVVVALAAEPRGSLPELIDAAEVARRFGVTSEWVRENADRLGVIRLGTGARPRLRFDAERVASALTDREDGGASSREDSAAQRSGPRRRRTREVAGAPGLLPFDTFNSPESEKSGPGAAATARDQATRSDPSPRSEPTRRGSGSRAGGRAPRAGVERSRDG